MTLEEKQLKSKCMEILRQYENVLLYIQEDEEKKLNKEKKIGDTEYDTLKRTIYSEGIKEGLRRVLIAINRIASTDD